MRVLFEGGLYMRKYGTLYFDIFLIQAKYNQKAAVCSAVAQGRRPASLSFLSELVN